MFSYRKALTVYVDPFVFIGSSNFHRNIIETTLSNITNCTDFHFVWIGLQTHAQIGVTTAKQTNVTSHRKCAILR